MEISDKVHGVHSKVYIQYEGSLQDLGSKIEKGLNIPTLRYENMEDEPYDLVGYAEIFGFEVELKELQKNDKWPNYQYFLGATTTDSFQEIFNDRMFDISLWMARYISLMCEVTTMAENLDKQTGQSFYLNITTSKRESSFVEAKK
ncbi:hypothetical protein SAMN04487969_108143 [Paenibacillus algorifonticola]|uniref:Uncharacterized protein n=1 Tax=Paenibacillus algorifonticola TaxID=684063 RepID=A0A1I2E3G1_9BACL|nr:hypothetical protein [Paenibacillus algorifonticola]SFE87071.1 hypothetical protein SAMN04487969_108143 [Paenibacillus algorifonticola]